MTSLQPKDTFKMTEKSQLMLEKELIQSKQKVRKQSVVLIEEKEENNEEKEKEKEEEEEKEEEKEPTPEVPVPNEVEGTPFLTAAEPSPPVN